MSLDLTCDAHHLMCSGTWVDAWFGQVIVVSLLHTRAGGVETVRGPGYSYNLDILNQ